MHFRSIDPHYVAPVRAPRAAGAPAIYYRTARDPRHSNLGRRKREDGKTIYLGELYRSSPDNCAPRVRAHRQASPLGFLRGVGERACLFICRTAIRRAIAAVYRIVPIGSQHALAGA